MTLPELIDSLIELSTEEMPDEARKSLDDAIDHIVSSMTNEELQGLLVKGMEHIDADKIEIETLIELFLATKSKEMVRSLFDQSLGLA